MYSVFQSLFGDKKEETVDPSGAGRGELGSSRRQTKKRRSEHDEDYSLLGNGGSLWRDLDENTKVRFYLRLTGVWR